MSSEKKGFRLRDVLYYILRGRRLLAVSALVGLIIGIIVSGVGYIRGEMSKEYQVTSSIAIIAQTRSGTFASASNNPDVDDVRLAQEITDSAIYVLRSERTLVAAIEKAKLTGVSVRDIQSNLTLNQYNETQIIEMTLYWRSGPEGVRILQAINEVSGDILLETLKIGNVSVVNSPSSRYIIGGSVSASTWILSAFLGMGLAVLVCVLKLFIAPLLTSVSDSEELYSMEVMGTIPYDKAFGDSQPFSAEGTAATKDIVSLAHILANKMSRQGYKKLLITSSIHGEGRTSLAVNIANQIAASGKKTLMVDCDFKNPKLSSMFDGHIPYEKTLNAVYYGETDELDAICPVSDCLDLLPVILGEKKIAINTAMLQLINRIAEPYDYVIIDAAPVGIDAEVINFKEIIDAALFVAMFDYAELEDIEKASKRLTGSGVTTIGCVVTSVKTLRDILREAQKVSQFIRNPKKKADSSAKKEKKKDRRKKKDSDNKTE